MARQKRTIFTNEMDAVLREFYPTAGGPETMNVLRDRFGVQVTKSQMHDRCRQLNLRSGFNTRDVASPVPLWKAGDIIGFWLIKEHLEFRRQTGRKVNHIYLVQCLPCGRIHKRAQESLRQSARKGCISCPDCTRERMIESKNIGIKGEINESVALLHRNEFIKFNRLMPRLSEEFWPYAHRPSMPHL